VKVGKTREGPNIKEELANGEPRDRSAGQFDRGQNEAVESAGAF